MRHFSGSRTHGVDTRSIVLVLLLTAAGWKAALLAWDVFPFNSDEAIVALMARHILAGARPVFFYGQAYMGSLDAYLVALGFWVFDQQVWVVRLVQTLLYVVTMITTIWLGKVGLGSLRTGVLAAFLLVIPTVNVTLYTTVSLGGYGEALLLGNLMLLSGWWFWQAHSKSRATDPRQTPLRSVVLGWGILGLLTGLGLWANGLTLVYALPVWALAGWLLFKRRPAGWKFSAALVACGAAGMLLGSAPWWIYAVQDGWQSLFSELLGSAVAVEEGSWIMLRFQHLLYFFVFGLPVIFGMRPPWEIRWLALPLMPLALAFWLAAMVWFGHRVIKPSPQSWFLRLLAGVALLLLAGFVLTPFGVDPSGRYFLPLTVPLALVAADGVQCLPWRRTWQMGAIAVVLLFNAWGTLECARRNPPGLTTQFYLQTAVNHRFMDDLIDFLRREQEWRGYTNYWVAYPLAFHSREQLIYVPGLPYHPDLRYTARDDRYSPYTQAVAESRRVAYITTRNPALDALIRAHFTRRELSWEEKIIGDYRVYYRISAAVRPVELGFGGEAP